MKTQTNAREATVRSKVSLSLGLIILVAIILPSATSAEIIKIGLEGVVDNVHDSYGLLENKIHTSDAITGYYIYDSETSNTSLFYGMYLHSVPPFGVTITIGNAIFQTNIENVSFKIGIGNDNQGKDDYAIFSYNNLGFSNGAIVNSISWQLTDYSGLAISSNDLPVTPPDLSEWQFNVMDIRGCSPLDVKKDFAVYGHITSVYLIPEPCSLILLGLGGLFLRRKF